MTQIRQINTDFNTLRFQPKNHLPFLFPFGENAEGKRGYLCVQDQPQGRKDFTQGTQREISVNLCVFPPSGEPKGVCVSVLNNF